MTGGSPIYLDYDQAELDRQYDQRTLVPDTDVYFSRWAEDTEHARSELECALDIPYGDGELEKLDIYGTDLSGAPIIVFLHGGAWRGGSKDISGGLARTYVPEGIQFAAVDFDVAPNVPLGAMVDQARRAVAFVARTGSRFGADTARVFAMGVSSGAHMAAMTAVTDWRADFELEPDTVKGLSIASGPYDLEPVILSARNDYLHLRPEDVQELSPKHFLDRLWGPACIAWGGRELPEFQRQGRAFADAIAAAGKAVSVHTFEDRNHFEMHEELGNADSTLFEATVEMIPGSG